MGRKATRYDGVEYLETDEDMAAYLDAILEEGDPQLLSVALGDVAKAKGMTQLARESGVTRDGLYKALSSSGNPSFDTLAKVLSALGLRFGIKPARA